MGLLIAILLLISLTLFFLGWGLWFLFTHAGRFLSLSRPIAADWLIVEGWLNDRAVQAASEEFFRGNYAGIITTGPPLTQGAFLAKFGTYADITKATLVALGVPAQTIISAPCLDVARFRTGTAAITVRNYFVEHQQWPQRGINLFTHGCHARRSLYVYQQVFQAHVPVGVIAAPENGFDLYRWWTTSTGVRTVLAELISYLYIRFVRWHD